ncbi:MAG: HDOD domain-containing protein [Syntrophobacteraceae bacterium]|jgi:HD-like signal output (HDOD) protein/nitrogen-specific signal transduction histidine kinase|nr:HDOD domain-containing protein [Syntrophobacteraceae bacterium]
MEREERSVILRRLVEWDTFPSPSPLLMQLVELAADEKATPRSLARIIEQDPGLTTRLIKVANSAAYARRRQVSSIADAALLMGFNRLRVMALTVSLRDGFPMGRVGGMDYERFWKTSLYRGIIAQNFARCLGNSDLSEEEAFVGGLILEMGMLLLFQICPATQRDCFPGGSVSLAETLHWEREHLGLDHRAVGRVVLQRWHFPESLVEAQRFHGPEALADGRPIPARILELARSASQLFFGRRTDFEIIQKTAASIGVSAEQVSEILCRTFFQVEEAAEALRLRPSTDKDILEALEKANVALARINGTLQLNIEKFVQLVTEHQGSGDWCLSDALMDKKKAVENVLDAVAHEIRNPLMAIGGFAQRLARNVEEKNELLKYASIIIQESSRLEQVFKGVVAVSQPYQPTFSESDLIGVLDEAIEELRNLMEEKRIEVIRNYGRELLPLLIDAKAIRKAIQQLLKTVVQLVEEESAVIQVELPSGGAAGEVRIFISGRGWTIPDEVGKVLSGFDFSGKTLGVGFGLLMTRKILEAHEGTIHWKQTQESASFEVRLPVSSL